MERQFKDANGQDASDVTADTCVPLWYAGDRMDWNLGVAHLFSCSEKGAADTIN